jgi:uncharacterized membrane protein YbaN (DUF454 family)
LIFIGTVSLCIGVLGIFIPGLPATPFLLLTAALYVRGSDRLYQTLITNKYLGSYILKFRTDKGMTKGLKLYSFIIMWFMIIISCAFFITPVPIVLLFILPTTNNSKL